MALASLQEFIDKTLENERETEEGVKTINENMVNLNNDLNSINF